MAKRARLTDANDPLSNTDKVLAGFEQAASKLASQQVNLTESQPASKSESQELTAALNNQPEVRTIAREITSQPSSQLTSEQVDKLTSQPDIGLVINVEEIKQANKLTSQEVNKLTIRKFTFQLDEVLMKELQKFYLQLQLDLGETAPYKEVIVEEAIAKLLALEDRSSLIEDLQARQKSRKQTI